MKKIAVCIGLFIAIAGTAEAQTKSKKKATKTATTANKANTQHTIVRQESTSERAAKMPAIPRSRQGWMNTPTPENNLQISDPVVRTLNERANGATIPIDFRKFMGVGRGTYGIAHGQILLRPNAATTSGGITGSGAVGTGSTPGGIGVHGSVMGVNGKNPYAGTGMWGTTGTGIGTNFRMNDASSRPIQLKKED